MTNKYIFAILFLTTTLQFGASIRCYECNSANNSMCLDPTLYDSETVQKFLHTINCDDSVLAAAHSSESKMFCRKIVQTILHKGHDTDVRVTRGCGWVKHHRDCYKADNEDHLETVCQCFTDDCNGASAITFSVATVLISVGLFLKI